MVVKTEKELLRVSADRWISNLNANYRDCINESVAKSKVLDYTKHNGLCIFNKHNIQIDVVSQIVPAMLIMSTDKSVITNFGTYDTLCGNFLKGNTGIEESLCSMSTLYLVNKAFKSQYYDYNRHNRGYLLYADRYIYASNVTFIYPHNKGIVWRDIITCSLPEYTKILRRNDIHGDKHKMYDKSLRSRLEYLLTAASYRMKEELILPIDKNVLKGYPVDEFAKVLLDVVGSVKTSSLKKVVINVMDNDDFNTVKSIIA